eukprot:scaffold306132_cov18-Tisochrysis_lutea.AAC.1
MRHSVTRVFWVFWGSEGIVSVERSGAQSAREGGGLCRRGCCKSPRNNLQAGAHALAEPTAGDPTVCRGMSPHSATMCLFWVPTSMDCKCASAYAKAYWQQLMGGSMGLQGLWVSTAAVERREEGACTGNLFCFSLHGRAKRKSDMAERRASCMYISGEEQALVK